MMSQHKARQVNAGSNSSSSSSPYHEQHKPCENIAYVYDKAEPTSASTAALHDREAAMRPNGFESTFIPNRTSMVRPLSCMLSFVAIGAVGGGGGRASAAVLQDAEKRVGAAAPAAAAETLDLKPPKGTRDVFPEDMRLRNW